MNAIRVAWIAPYATAYQVQYWTGEDAMDDQGNGEWKNFSSGVVTNGKGGTATLTSGFLAGQRKVCPGSDDRFFEHLRHSRFERSPQLRRLRYQGNLRWGQ